MILGLSKFPTPRESLRGAPRMAPKAGNFSCENGTKSLRGSGGDPNGKSMAPSLNPPVQKTKTPLFNPHGLQTYLEFRPETSVAKSSCLAPSPVHLLFSTFSSVSRHLSIFVSQRFSSVSRHLFLCRSMTSSSSS
ncbi:hypothetical protein PIB30_054805 [Stylosanthes scabra]|uniref:Uncharacterized protein n=1 Tax=Stylosanthes scabra TaxID=79078 RepID=A0ABU6VII0_9FABA|nr:hypothetical protein [Stylosanthes scabra]